VGKPLLIRTMQTGRGEIRLSLKGEDVKEEVSLTRNSADKKGTFIF
jgi:hypothetical protein